MNSPRFGPADEEEPPMIFNESFRRRLDDSDGDIQLPRIQRDDLSDEDEDQITERFHTERPMLNKNTSDGSNEFDAVDEDESL